MEFKSYTINGITGNVVRFDYISSEPHEAFSIYAYNTGIEFVGQSPRIKTREDLDGFALTVTTAWQKHLQLKGSISNER